MYISALLVTLLTLSFVARSGFNGTVIAVHDGDTFTTKVGANGPIHVRLAYIDAPELSQPFGVNSRSRNTLSDYIMDKTVTIIPTKRDKYQRTIAEVYYNDLNINHEMVSSGSAWAYLRFTPAKEEWAIVNRQIWAQIKGVGIWSLPQREQCPPWSWRARKCPSQRVKEVEQTLN